MSYKVEVTPPARRELKVLHNLSENPRPTRTKELRDKPNIYRIWLARKWRIAYRIDEEQKRILVLRVRLKDYIDYESL